MALKTSSLHLHDYGTLLWACMTVLNVKNISLKGFDKSLEEASGSHLDFSQTRFRIKCDMHEHSQNAQELVLGLLQRGLCEIHHYDKLVFLHDLSYAEKILAEYEFFAPAALRVSKDLTS